MKVATASAGERAVRSTLSRDEIEQAIRSLATAGWIRLRKVANAYCRGRALDPEELLQEAITRALDGSRTCPAGVDVVRFLAEAMRSIASDTMEALQRQPEFLAEPLIDERGNPLDIPDPLPTTESRLVDLREAKRIATAVLALFEDDETAAILVMGMMDDMDGEELRELTGLNKTAFASKRRLVRRRIDQAFPRGWKP